MTKEAKKASWKLVEGVATYNAVNGDTAEFDLDSVLFNPAITKQLLYYGLKQKLADSIAGIGKGATDAMKIADMTDTYDRLTGDDGQWNKASVERAKLITEADFMSQAKENNVPEEMAKMMWNLARKAQ